MKATPSAPSRPRWAPALAVFSLAVVSGGAGALTCWGQARAEAARASALALELEERSRAATRLRDRLGETSGATVSAGLWAGLGSLAAPAEAPPVPPAWPWALVWGGAAALAAVGVHMRWSRPLAAMERELNADPAGGAKRASGPAALRSLRWSLERFRRRTEADAEARANRWRAGLEALAAGSGRAALDPEVRPLAEAAEAAVLERAQVALERSEASRRALEAAEAAEREVARRALEATERWRVADASARAAVERLAALEGELPALVAARRAHARVLRETASTFHSGIARASRRAEELADQASRAVDAAASERARAARIARGGRAGPVEAPPLDRWAADLDDAARALGELCETLQVPPEQPEGAEEVIPRDVLTAGIDAATAARDAVEATGPLVGAVEAWAQAHAGGIARLVPRTGDVGSPPAGRLDEDLGALEARAREARARVDELAARAERLLAAWRGSDPALP
jgi:hypothetical protein